MKKFMKNNVVGNRDILYLLRFFSIICIVVPFLFKMEFAYKLIIPEEESSKLVSFFTGIAALIGVMILKIFFVAALLSVISAVTAFVRRGWKILPLIGAVSALLCIIVFICMALTGNRIFLDMFFVMVFPVGLFNFVLFIFSYDSKYVLVKIFQVSTVVLLSVTVLLIFSEYNENTFNFFACATVISTLILSIVGNHIEKVRNKTESIIRL